MYLPFYYERLPWNTTRSMSLCWFIIFTIVLCTEFLSLDSRTNIKQARQLLTSAESACWGCCWKLYAMTMLSGILSLCSILSPYLRGYSLSWGETMLLSGIFSFSSKHQESIGSSPEWSTAEEHQFIFCFIFASFDKRVSSIIYKVLRVWSYRVVFLSGTP